MASRDDLFADAVHSNSGSEAALVRREELEMLLARVEAVSKSKPPPPPPSSPSFSSPSFSSSSLTC
jgi:hypothetical protein